MRVQRWNYKGLICEITKHKKGYTACVSDIGVITNKELPLIYKGGPQKINRYDLEKEVDEFLAEQKEPSLYCGYYGTAIVLGYCYLNCQSEGCEFSRGA